MRIRNSILNRLVYWSLHRRTWIYTTSLLLTLGLGAAAKDLRLDVRWTTLLPESIPEVREYKKIDEDFYLPGGLIIAISGPDQVKLESLTDEVTKVLQAGLVCDPALPSEECKAKQRYARFVYGKLPETWLERHALRLVKPNDARRWKDLLADPRLLPYLTHLNDDFEREYIEGENLVSQERQVVASLDAVEGLVESLKAASSNEVNAAQVSRVVRDLTIGRPYFFSLDNTMSLVTIATAFSTDDSDLIPLIDRRVEALLAPIAQEHPDYRIERTGMIALGRDEMDSVGPQTMVITAIAFLIILLLLIWNFRSSATPVLVSVPIVVGLIWTVGVITLTIGSMNIFTVMIGVVLLGLGIDFSIHIASRFHEELAHQHSLEEALRLSVSDTGKGVITGALTTAAAFFTLMIADTKGIKEFGFCSGTGVLLILLAVFLILPSLMASWVEHRDSRRKPLKPPHDFSLLGALATWIGRHRRVVILAGAIATALGFWSGRELQWEWNWLKLEPKGLRSIELQDEILEKFKLSISMCMLTVDDVEKSRSLRKAFKEKRVVGEVDDISQWLSRTDYQESRGFLQVLRANLENESGPLSFTAQESEEGAQLRRERLGEQLERLWANVVEIQALSFTAGLDRVVEKCTHLVATRENRANGLLRQASEIFAGGDMINWQTVDSFSESFGRELRTQAKRLSDGEQPVTLAMLPQDILGKYASTHVPGYMMQIFPKKNIFEKADLELFQNVVTNIDPNVTGMAQMFLHMNRETLREGKLASLAAIAVIFIVLLIDFRRPLISALAFLPLVSGTALMFAVMWLTGEKLNYLNLIAFPVIIGIGVDDGVHLFHRFLQEGKGGLGRAVTSVGRAILMTSLTTMIGFGSLLLYLMQGMASLGFVLVVGVGWCFIVTVTLIPAMAKMFERRILRLPVEGDTDVEK